MKQLRTGIAAIDEAISGRGSLELNVVKASVPKRSLARMLAGVPKPGKFSVDLDRAPETLDDAHED